MKIVNTMFVSRSTLPIITKGKGNGSPSIAIGKNGQISFSKITTEALGAPPTNVVNVAYDPTTHALLFVAHNKTNSAKHKLDPNEGFTLKFAKKGGTAHFAATSLLIDEKTFTDGVYDYKGSGNQVFAAELDTEKNMVQIILPVGAISPRPVTARKPRKEKAVAVGVGGTSVMSTSKTGDGEVDGGLDLGNVG